MMDRSKDKVEIYQRADGDWDWRRKDPQGRVLCGSSQGYTDVTFCELMAINLCADLLDEESFSRVPSDYVTARNTRVLLARAGQQVGEMPELSEGEG